MHHITTGAGNDIERATDMARKMVCEWGMSELGPMSFGKKEEQIFLGREIAQHRDYSEATAIRIDEQVRKLVENGYQRARKIIEERTDAWCASRRRCSSAKFWMAPKSTVDRRRDRCRPCRANTKPPSPDGGKPQTGDPARRRHQSSRPARWREARQPALRLANSGISGLPVRRRRYAGGLRAPTSAEPSSRCSPPSSAPTLTTPSCGATSAGI